MTKLNLPWNSLAIVSMQINDASITDRQPVNTTIEKYVTKQLVEVVIDTNDQ